MKKLFLFFVFCASGIPLFAKDTTLHFFYKKLPVEVVVKRPSTNHSRGTILLLHGYNLPPMQWCEKTTFCNEALKRGFTLVIPNFSRSTYQEKFYPHTDSAMLKYPTRKWIRDTVIAVLQEKIKLLLPGKNNFVLGLSTGARGAALLAHDLPTVFRATGCLSGDFDQTKLPYEKIYIRYYGSFKLYGNTIWKNDDNLHTLISSWETPIYLAHGDQDKICPASQTINFYSLLKKTHPKLVVKYHIDKGYKHDYAFWGKHTNGVLTFFESFIVK